MNVGSYKNVVNILKPEDTSIINLTKSYRSTMEITKFSRKILRQEIHDEYVERIGEWPKLTGLLDEEDINERIVKEVKVYKDEEDRLLLYTACTRAIHVLDIFYLGKVSSLLK